MTARIREFLRNRRESGLDGEACLVVDLDVVRDNYTAFAASWAITTLFELDQIFRHTLDVVLFGCGLAVMVSFIRSASRVESFTARD